MREPFLVRFYLHTASSQEEVLPSNIRPVVAAGPNRGRVISLSPQAFTYTQLVGLFVLWNGPFDCSGI